jgi:protein-disulfide isomerase
MKKFYTILAVVAVVGIAAVGYAVGSNRMGKAATEPIDVAGLDNMETLVAKAVGVTKGDPAAPITIAEFADYQCPACGAFALTVKPQVDLIYVQTGKAKFVYYDFPLISIHQHTFLASRAGRCANDQEKFWEFQQVMFRNQSTWASKTDVIGDFVDYAGEAGADKDVFDACLRSDAHAETITANLRLAEALGLDGTPTVMVSMGRGMARRLMSADFQSIKAAIEELEAQAAPPVTPPPGN